VDSTLILGDTPYNRFWVGYPKGNIYAENQFDPFSRFDTIPACDGQADGHQALAYIVLDSVAR